MDYPLPHNEAERLAALKDLRILDTPAEERFDRITRLAAQILDTPIVLISLVDESRQWFKSRHGLDATETPRCYAFCTHAIMTPKVMVVPDALEDGRFNDNPLVVGGPKIRFYAGAPLMLDAETRVGTLCAIDVAPRAITAKQASSLEDLAKIVVEELLLRGRVKDLVDLTDLLDDQKAKLAATSEQLQAANIELERSNHDLEQFAYAASHDLQEPLRQVGSYAGLLSARLAPKLDEQSSRHFGYVIEGAARMEVLLKGLLDYARIGQSGEATPVDCNNVVKDVIADLTLAVQDANAVVHTGTLPTILVEPTRLRQLFQNLISNALKFRREEPPPVISITCVANEHEHHFCVEDNGIGIDAQYYEKIFRVFQRLHRRNEYPGSGIGLALCQRIVAGWGGKIWIESVLGEGTKVFFSLPHSDAASQTPADDTSDDTSDDTGG